MRRLWTRRCAALTSLAGAACWLSPTLAADAHPFGEPQSAEISATDTGLRIVWNASPDDLGVLAAWLGVNAGSLTVIEDGELVSDESSVPPGIQLARAPHLSDYLLERIEVTADEPCSGSLLPVDDVEATGVTLDFDCGGPVPAADVRIATLTDVDESYRTLATGPFGQGEAYVSDTGAVTWALTSADAAPDADGGDHANGARSAALQLGGAGVGAAALAGVGMLVIRRRRSRPDRS